MYAVRVQCVPVYVCTSLSILVWTNPLPSLQEHFYSDRYCGWSAQPLPLHSGVQTWSEGFSQAVQKSTKIAIFTSVCVGKEK